MAETARQRGLRKRRTGRVISRSGNKSVVVLVERRWRHPMYSKVMRQSRKYHTHDEKNEAHVGDTVRLVETRPLSRTKRWRIEAVLVRHVVPVEEGLTES